MENFVTDSWTIDGSKTLNIVRMAKGYFMVVFKEKAICYENLSFKCYLDSRQYAKCIISGYKNVVYNGSK